MKNNVILITGTDTGVGKTISTAALALHYRLAGQRVCVIKPVQSGVDAGEESDIAMVVRLAGIPEADAFEGVRLPEPLAPTQAAQRAGIPLPPMQSHAQFIAQAADTYDVVLVEGAGGVSVELDSQGHSLIDLATMLPALGVSPKVIVVNRAGLGTLNHTRLTVWSLQLHEIPILGMVVGAAPEDGDLAGELNMDEMRSDAYPPIITILPDQLGQVDGPTFERILTTHWQSHPVAL